MFGMLDVLFGGLVVFSVAQKAFLDASLISEKCVTLFDQNLFLYLVIKTQLPRNEVLKIMFYNNVFELLFYTDMPVNPYNFL
jgi:hypothetical protein